MLKLLLTVAVVVVALMLWFGKGRERAAPIKRSGRSGSQTPAPMIACAHCGVHLPRADAFLDDQGRPYCDAEHRRRGPARGARA